MNKFICTFGCGSPLATCVQPVSAETDEDARRAMRYFYADKWAFCYRIGDCQLKLQQFVTLPTIEVRGDDIYVTRVEGLPASASAADAKPKFKYKVRVTRMLNTWVEVEAANQDEAESKAYDAVVGKAKDDPCWSDDDDAQVEDDTHIMVDGKWKRARFVPEELGGEGVPEHDPEDD